MDGGSPGPDPGWIGGLSNWLSEFGTGAKGFVALFMVLATLAVIFCAPSMWSAWLTFKIDKLKYTKEHKELDLKIAKRIERIAESQKRKEQS